MRKNQSPGAPAGASWASVDVFSGGVNDPENSTAVEPTQPETVPGIAAARRRRWTEALGAFADAAILDLGVTGPAWAAFKRSTSVPALRRLVTVAAGAAWPPPKGWRPLSGRPGPFGMGAARGELDVASRTWRELPLEDLREGAIGVTLPLFVASTWRGQPILECLDVIFCDPRTGEWGSLTDLHAGLLGPTSTEINGPVRIAQDLRMWIKGGGSTVPGLGAWPPSVVILDEEREAAERLILDADVIVNQDEAAAAWLWTQTRARRRALRRLRDSVGGHGRIFVESVGNGGAVFNAARAA